MATIDTIRKILGDNLSIEPEQIEEDTTLDSIDIDSLALVVAFFGYAMVVTPQYVVTALLYALALAILPVVYLVAALKIKRSL